VLLPGIVDIWWFFVVLVLKPFFHGVVSVVLAFIIFVLEDGTLDFSSFSGFGHPVCY
jgi:hypothetical protein